MTWIFGPVPSRRFGRSLGIDLFTRKTCTFDCVYCEVGRTARTTGDVGSFAPTAEVLDELHTYLAEHHDDLPDFITFAGSGEPTLHREIDEIIRGIRQMTTVPIVLLTNGSLLHRKQVLARVLDVDYLVPSLDAGCEETFHRINRPHAAITFEDLTHGLLAARQAYRKHYLLEILLVRGINTSDEEMGKLKAWVDRIEPDAVQVNTVFRPPAEHDAHAATPEEIQRFVDLVGEKATPVAYYSNAGVRRHIQGALLQSVLVKTLGIRPCTVEEMTDSLGVSPQAMTAALEALDRAGRIQEVEHEGATHIALKRGSEGM